MDAIKVPEWGKHVGAGLAMLTGLALVTAGSRIQFALRFTGGGLAFFGGMWFLLGWAMGEDREHHVMSRWLGVCITGLLGGLLSGWSRHIGGLVVGGMAGGVVALVFFSFVPASVYMLFLVAFLASQAGVVLVVQFSSVMYVILTSVFGGLCFALGLDHFLKVGLLSFLDPRQTVAPKNGLVIMLSAVVALAFVGVLLQFRHREPSYKRLHSPHKF